MPNLIVENFIGETGALRPYLTDAACLYYVVVKLNSGKNNFNLL